MGSAVKSIKYDPTKQKLVPCVSCKEEMVVIGKYAKKDQKCKKCKDIFAQAGNQPKQKTKEIDNKSFAARLQDLCNKLEFTITDKRTWKKRYPIDGGGVATVHIMPEQAMTGMGSRIEYFSLVIQRAVGVNEDFRKFMPTSAASDCELIVGELGQIQAFNPKLGQEKCDRCNEYTDEFGVDPKAGKILCIKPNNCFKKYFTSRNAEAEQ